MDNPIILIITDSVALPREYPNGIVLWDEIYISNLKEALPQYTIINVSIGGASIVDLRNQVNYYKILKPEIVILQCGIVDASPRAFGRLEMDVIKKMKLFRLTKPFVNFLRKYRSHHYASPGLFEKKLQELIQELNPKIFYSLGILNSCEDYEKILPGITKSIDIYNAILQRNTNFIDLSAMPREGILSDHHHINKIGHNYIYQELLKVIK